MPLQFFCAKSIAKLLHLRFAMSGFGAVWCGLHPQEKAEKRVAEILGADEMIVPLSLIWIGHPAEQPEARVQYEESKVHYIQ